MDDISAARAEVEEAQRALSEAQAAVNAAAEAGAPRASVEAMLTAEDEASWSLKVAQKRVEGLEGRQAEVDLRADRAAKLVAVKARRERLEGWLDARRQAAERAHGLMCRFRLKSARASEAKPASIPR